MIMLRMQKAAQITNNKFKTRKKTLKHLIAEKCDVACEA